MSADTTLTKTAKSKIGHFNWSCSAAGMVGGGYPRDYTFSFFIANYAKIEALSLVTEKKMAQKIRKDYQEAMRKGMETSFLSMCCYEFVLYCLAESGHIGPHLIEEIATGCYHDSTLIVKIFTKACKNKCEHPEKAIENHILLEKRSNEDHPWHASITKGDGSCIQLLGDGGVSYRKLVMPYTGSSAFHQDCYIATPKDIIQAYQACRVNPEKSRKKMSSIIYATNIYEQRHCKAVVEHEAWLHLVKQQLARAILQLTQRLYEGVADPKTATISSIPRWIAVKMGVEKSLRGEDTYDWPTKIAEKGTIGAIEEAMPKAILIDKQFSYDLFSALNGKAFADTWYPSCSQ